jgi:hypothetical protein
MVALKEGRRKREEGRRKNFFLSLLLRVGAGFQKPGFFGDFWTKSCFFDKKPGILIFSRYLSLPFFPQCPLCLCGSKKTTSFEDTFLCLSFLSALCAFVVQKKTATFDKS